jgi:hypothetical protein
MINQSILQLDWFWMDLDRLAKGVTDKLTKNFFYLSIL